MKQLNAFITIFTLFSIYLIPAISLRWLTKQLGIMWVFWTVLVLSAIMAIVSSR